MKIDVRLFQFFIGIIIVFTLINALAYIFLGITDDSGQHRSPVPEHIYFAEARKGVRWFISPKKSEELSPSMKKASRSLEELLLAILIPLPIPMPWRSVRLRAVSGLPVGKGRHGACLLTG